jgi:hypothetical protein
VMQELFPSLRNDYANFDSYIQLGLLFLAFEKSLFIFKFICSFLVLLLDSFMFHLSLRQ